MAYDSSHPKPNYPAALALAVVLLLILLPGLSGCATTRGADPEPEVRTVPTIVERAVSCVPENLGDAPAYPDTDEALAAARDAAERYALIAAGRPLRIARLGAVEPVIAECREAAGE